MAPYFALPLGFYRDAGATLAAPPLLTIDTNRRRTSGPIYRPGERVIFWYNLPGGSASAFLIEGFQTVIARDDGTTGMTILAADCHFPAEVTSVVAHGQISNVTIVYIVPPK